MPEGDTVWRTARSLDQALSGTQVRTDFRVPDLATLVLDESIITTLSRGKHLLTRFAGGLTLHTHLKMEGSWHLYRAGDSWRRPGHQARVLLHGSEWTAVGFSLGLVEVLPTAEEDRAVGHLGPDLLGPDWNAAEAVSRLSADPERPLVEALLDQTNLAGIGNVYAAELCFLAGRHPLSPVADTDVTRLVDRAYALLQANKDRAERSTTGDLRRDRRSWVYGRARRPCLRCGTTILTGTHGSQGRERVSYHCPHCQPDPATG